MNIPAVGTKGRYHVGSDIYPVTCRKVSPSGKIVWFTEENFRAGPGHDYFGQQNWICEERRWAPLVRADWSAKRQRYQVRGHGSIFFDGQWMARQDPSF